MKGEDRREWAVETGRGRAEGGTGRAETESVACVLVPSPVRPLSAGDLWHPDWEQPPLPALYCYYWQLMRPDGLSSTALNRGLHLHESRDLPFPFFPLSSFYFLLRSGSGVPQVCREIRQAEWTEAHGRVCVLASPSSRCCENDELHSGKQQTLKFSALRTQLLVTWPQGVFNVFFLWCLVKYLNDLG